MFKASFEAFDVQMLPDQDCAASARSRVSITQLIMQSKPIFVGKVLKRLNFFWGHGYFLQEANMDALLLH